MTKIFEGNGSYSIQLRKIIHTLIIYVWSLFATIFFGILAIIVSIFERNGNKAHEAGRAWSKSILYVSSIKVTIKGLFNINPDSSYIYMSNHQSNYDIHVLLGCLPVQFRWLAKAVLFKIPIMGHGMRGAGYISIDRSNRALAIESLNKAAQTISNGTSVLIFPEGTRSIDGNIRKFKKGGFYLAVNSGVPIVPVVIHGTRKIMQKKSFLINPGRNVFVEIMKPVETSGYTIENKDKLINKIRDLMIDSLNKKKESL